MQVPGDWITHRADYRGTTVGDGIKFLRLEKPKPPYRHFDERIHQALRSGKFEPLLDVFGKCRHWQGILPSNGHPANIVL